MNYFPFRKRCARNASSFASFVWYPKWRWRCLITKITVVLERSDAINVLIGYNCENGTATKIATIPICSADFANVQLSRKLKLSSITMPVSLRHTESTNQFRFEYQPEKIPNWLISFLCPSLLKIDKFEFEICFQIFIHGNGKSAKIQTCQYLTVLDAQNYERCSETT